MRTAERTLLVLIFQIVSDCCFFFFFIKQENRSYAMRSYSGPYVYCTKRFWKNVMCFYLFLFCCSLRDLHAVLRRRSDLTMARPPPDPVFTLRGSAASVNTLHFHCAEAGLPLLFSGWASVNHRPDWHDWIHLIHTLHFIHTFERIRFSAQADKSVKLYDVVKYFSQSGPICKQR